MTRKKTTLRLTKKPAFIQLFIQARCIYIIMMALMTAPTFAHAALNPMDNQEMEAVTGNGGFSMAIKNVQLFQYIDAYRYCASDNGYLELRNIKTFNADTFGPALFNFGTAATDSSGEIHFDIAEFGVGSVDDWSGDPATSISRIMSVTTIPDWDQKLAYFIGNIIFNGPDINTGTPSTVDLGSFYIGNIHMPRFSSYVSPPNGSGVEFQTSFQLTIDKLSYNYNPSTCAALEFCSTYIGGNFVDGADDPANPASWMPNRLTPVDFGEFQIGDLFGDISSAVTADWEHSNPAGMDIGEGDIYGTGDMYGSLALRLPMEGSIRFESANWITDPAANQAVNFGPGAIDGIQVHRLNLDLIP